MGIERWQEVEGREGAEKIRSDYLRRSVLVQIFLFEESLLSQVRILTTSWQLLPHAHFCMFEDFLQ